MPETANITRQGDAAAQCRLGLMIATDWAFSRKRRMRRGFYKAAKQSHKETQEV